MDKDPNPTTSGTIDYITPSPSPEIPKEEFIPYIPLGRKKYLQQQEVYGRPIDKGFKKRAGKDEKGEGLVTFEREITGGTLTLSFLKKVITEGLGDKKTPTLWRRGFRLWCSMLYFAKKAGGLNGEFIASGLARLWGIDPRKRGRLFKDIRETFYSVTSLRAYFTNNKSGKERREWGYAPLIKWEIRGEGRQSTYSYELNPEALSAVTKDWINQQLDKAKIKDYGGYIPYHLDLLKSGLPETEQNFRDRLLAFKGGYPVKAYTILNDWLKLRKDLLRRRNYCHQLLYHYLENAKIRGEISNYKFEVRGLTDWRNKWKVTIYKPTAESRAEARLKRGGEVNTKKAGELIETIFKWQNKAIHGIRKPPEELRKQIENTVKAYGVEVVGEIYERTANGAKPSTYDFWQEIKELKRQKAHKTTNG